MAQFKKSDIILKIQELTFACVDLNLYLDNHPDDTNAINMFNTFSRQLNEVICNYESKYGPLTNFGYGKSNCPWQWIEEPWPWDNKFYN